MTNVNIIYVIITGLLGEIHFFFSMKYIILAFNYRSHWGEGVAHFLILTYKMEELGDLLGSKIVLHNKYPQLHVD